MVGGLALPAVKADHEELQGKWNNNKELQEH